MAGLVRPDSVAATASRELPTPLTVLTYQARCTLGLTATPPHLMTAEQAVLHRALFGRVDLEVSAPALVREGLLAPYQELAFLTRPSPAEADYIHGESLRFAELRAGLLDPSFASVPFLGWLQARVVERRSAGGAQVSWTRFEKDEPALADAAVRLHVAGLLARAASSLIRRRRRGRTAAVVLAGAILVATLAAAVADALHAAGLTSWGGDAVRVEAQADGGYRARLQEVPTAESALFAEALDEVLAPLSQPRYVIPRLILPPPAGPAAAAGLAVRRLVTGHVPATVVYHAVPTVLSGHKKLALGFERAWNARVGPGSVVYAGSPEGTGILAAQRGDDPFALTTQVRTLWR